MHWRVCSIVLSQISDDIIFYKVDSAQTIPETSPNVPNKIPQPRTTYIRTHSKRKNKEKTANKSCFPCHLFCFFLSLPILYSSLINAEPHIYVQSQMCCNIHIWMYIYWELFASSSHHISAVYENTYNHII